MPFTNQPKELLLWPRERGRERANRANRRGVQSRLSIPLSRNALSLFDLSPKPRRAESPDTLEDEHRVPWLWSPGESFSRLIILSSPVFSSEIVGERRPHPPSSLRLLITPENRRSFSNAAGVRTHRPPFFLRGIRCACCLPPFCGTRVTALSHCLQTSHNDGTFRRASFCFVVVQVRAVVVSRHYCFRCTERCGRCSRCQPHQVNNGHQQGVDGQASTHGFQAIVASNTEHRHRDPCHAV